MGDYHERRIEGRNAPLSTYDDPTPESMEALRRRQLEGERLNRAPPKQPFAQVLGASRARAAAASDAPPAAALAPEPTPGPKVRQMPGVRHPDEVALYGRHARGTTVRIKG